MGILEMLLDRAAQATEGEWFVFFMEESSGGPAHWVAEFCNNGTDILAEAATKRNAVTFLVEKLMLFGAKPPEEEVQR